MSKPTREEFYLFRRHCKTGSFWYVKFVDPNTSLIMTAKSVDVLKEQMGLGYATSVRSKAKAAVIAQKALESGMIFGDRSQITFVDFCRDFWDYENSAYVKTRNAIKPNSIGREYCKNMLINFNLHVAPEFNEKLRIQNVTVRQLDTLVRKLLAEGKISNGTIQLVIISFSQPLKEALRQGLIMRNPSENLLRVARRDKTRGVLTYEECIFFCDKAREMFKSGKLYSSYYLAITLAISTGMRSGEIRALKTENIVESDLVRPDGVRLDRIIVKESIAPYSGIKCTKGKYERQLCVPHAFGQMLKNNADDKGRVFPSKYGGYIAAPTLRNAFTEILCEIGISREQQEERNLSFHSLRHGFATISRDSNISQEDRMLVLGHKSEKVNNIYTHVTDSQLERVSNVTSNIIGMFGIKYNIPKLEE